MTKLLSKTTECKHILTEVTTHKAFKIETKADFEKLFATHYSNLCAYANNFIKDIDASEEVVQEVLFKLWTNKESIIITSSVQSYLFRAVRNASVKLSVI